MIRQVFIGGKPVAIDPSNPLAVGGEARVYRVGTDRVVKVYKGPDDPDYLGNATEQHGAERRLIEQRVKLPAFPKPCPTHVVGPVELALDGPSGQLAGYVMPFLDKSEVLLSYTDQGFRASVDPNLIPRLFLNLHGAVLETHGQKIVIGDFNNLNVLVRGDQPKLIDADSMQFASFLCRVFTTRYVDPLVCVPDASGGLSLNTPHTELTDWYAFATMLMECLCFVHPYGGVYKPKNLADRLKPGERWQRRVTVFHPEVIYPKPAIPLARMPDDLLGLWERVFVKNERKPFDKNLLENLRWTTCTTCGTAHARTSCPVCVIVAPAAVKTTTTVRGKVTATRIFETHGAILEAALLMDRTIGWLYHESGAWRREDKMTLTAGDLSTHLHYGVHGKRTVFVQMGRIVTMGGGTTTTPQALDTIQDRYPSYAANAQGVFWTHNGQLYRDGALAPKSLGTVLAGQTRIWAGPTFGFGFGRAGALTMGFIFPTDGTQAVINDRVQLPPIRTKLIDAWATLSNRRCWFFTATQEAGKTINRVYVIHSDGRILGTAEAEAGSPGWLGTFGGACAVQDFLFAPTDDGFVRVTLNGSTFEEKVFPDTEPFVTSASKLFPSPQGIYVVSTKDIVELRIS